MQKSTKDKYIQYSLDRLQEQLVKEGIITKRIDNFKDTVLDIGEIYYKLKRKEDLT